MFEDFYGLSGRPFQLTPDPKFYFESLTHRKALSYLSYGLAQGEGFVVITGEVGAGKSTLVAHLMATVDPARLTAAQIVTSKLDAEELVHLVAQAFGLIVDGHDKASALGAIEAFLHDEARAGRRCLLVVDESQNLSLDALEELRMLSNFQLGAHPLLQTLLLGQPEFRETIHDHPRLEQLRQRVIAAHHLEAIEPGEVQPYVEHRLRCVGWQGNPAFDPAFFVMLHQASGGIPRKINQICNRVMMQGELDRLPRIEATTLRAVLAELDRDGAQRLNHEEGDAPAAPVAPVAPAEPTPETRVAHADHADEAEPPLPFAAPSFATPFEPAHAAPAVVEAHPEPIPPLEVAHAAPETSAPAHERPDWVARAELEVLLAERDHEIAALRDEIAALGKGEAGFAPGLASAGDEPRHAGLEMRFAALEAKMAEQEQTIRQTLTMLIEWIESDDATRVAA